MFPRSETQTARTPAPRNASKWRAAAGFEIFICPFPSGIEAPSTDVSFDLPIPLVGCEPFAETGELHRGKVRNSRLEILDAHPKRLSTKLGIANLRCPVCPVKRSIATCTQISCSPNHLAFIFRGKSPILFFWRDPMISEIHTLSVQNGVQRRTVGRAPRSLRRVPDPRYSTPPAGTSSP